MLPDGITAATAMASSATATTIATAAATFQPFSAEIAYYFAEKKFIFYFLLTYLLSQVRS